MKIYIPHLNYTIHVKRDKKPPEDIINAQAWVVSEGLHGCTLNIKTKTNPVDLSHEVVHILQFIALNRNIDFKLEHEHFGYLMAYIMGQVLGYEYR